MAQDSDPATLAFILAWTYGLEIAYGVFPADDSAVRASEAAMQTAQRTGNDNAVTLCEYGLGLVLLHRGNATDRRRGLELMEQALVMLRVRIPSLVPVTALWVARERARVGDRDAAITMMRDAVDELYEDGRLGYCLAGIGILAEALIERGVGGDLAEAEAAIDRITNTRAGDDLAIRDVILLRLRTLVARARADPSYGDLVRRYRTMAESHGYDGHITWAQEMDGGER
jgi:hypothetical protein